MFYDLVLYLTADLGDFIDLHTDLTPEVIRYECEYDGQDRWVILGEKVRPFP